MKQIVMNALPHARNPYIAIALGITALGLLYAFKSDTSETSALNDERVYSFDGATEIKGKKLTNVDNYGPASILNTTITGSTNVYGFLKATDSRFEDINVFGPAELKNIQLQDMNLYGKGHLTNITARDVEIYGPLTAENLTIQGELYVSGITKINNAKIKILTITSTHVALSNVRAKDIKISSTHAAPVIEIDGDSSIQSIIFDKNPGKVVLKSKSASVTTIQGGKIQKLQK